jgi:hypothetical protein
MLLYRSRLRRGHFKRDEVGSNLEKRHLGNIPSIQVRDAIGRSFPGNAAVLRKYSPHLANCR